MLIVVTMSISSSDFVRGIGGAEKYQPKFKCLLRPHLHHTLSPHFQVLSGTFRYLQVLSGTFRYLQVLLGTFRYFQV